jgi:peptidoglycan-associated lipoprotein
MVVTKRHLASALALVAVVAASGCVTKKVFRRNVEETNSRFQSVEGSVEENERRTADLGRETDQKIATVRQTSEKALEVGSTALQRAEAAEKIARGKILWETTLADDRVKFSFNQARLPEDATMILDELADRVRSMDRTVYLEIEGHTDNIGSEDYNMHLGEMRASAIRNYLANKGIPLHAMQVISYGESKAVASNSTRDGRAQNRRVVIRVLE